MKNNALTDEALDQLLIEYMPKANILLDQLEEEKDKDLEPHIFSRRYKRNMKRIIKEYSRTPFQNKLVKLRRYAAVILIIFTLTNGVLIATAQGYREIVFKVITNIYDRYTSIVTEVENPMERMDMELNFIEPSYIPEGFVLIDDMQTDIERMIYYMNEDKLITFSHGIIANSERKIDTEGTSIKEIEVNNKIINYVFNKEMYIAYWFDGGYEYSVNAEVSFEDFIKIIEGILNN